MKMNECASRIVPDLISEEEEVCQKLIQLSFVKIVNSKHERGGAKLHKNMMILHLLQKARSEHRSSNASSPTEMETTIPIQVESEDADSAADSNLRTDSKEELLANCQCDGDDNQFYPPPLLQFVSVEEQEDSSEIRTAEFSGELSFPVLPDTDDSYEVFLPEDLEIASEESFSEQQSVYQRRGGDFFEEKSETFTIISAKSKKSSSTDSGCSSGSGSSSSSSSDEEESDGDDSSFFGRQQSSFGSVRHRRKRKHSWPNSETEKSSKKTCCHEENVQLSGLITVFRQAGLGESFSAATTTSSGHFRTVCAANYVSESSLKAKNESLESRSCENCTVSSGKSHSVSCGTESTPPRSVSCPSFLELTCIS